MLTTTLLLSPEQTFSNREILRIATRLDDTAGANESVGYSFAR